MLHRLRSATARRLLAGALAATMLAPPAFARCQRDEDQSAFEIWALQRELMVGGLMGCGHEDRYRQFIERYRPQLVQVDRTTNAWFRRVHGGRAVAMHTAFDTELTNLRAQTSTRYGSDYCDRAKLVYEETLALPTPADLPAYAAGKDLLPAAARACAGEPAPRPTPPARQQPHRRGHTS